MRDQSDQAVIQRYSFSNPNPVVASAGFRLDDHLFGRVIQKADADMVELEGGVHLPRNTGQHLSGILTGNGYTGDIVEKGEIPSPLLLALESAGVFHGNRNLPGRRAQQLEIALIIGELAFIAQGRHHPRRLPVKEERHAAETFRPGTNGCEAKLAATLFHLRLNEQRFPGGDDVLRDAVRDFAAAFGENLAIFHLEFETDLVIFPEGDVKAARVEDLAQLAMNRTHDVVSVETGAYCLSNLSEQLVLFTAAAGLVELHVMVKCSAELS